MVNQLYFKKSIYLLAVVGLLCCARAVSNHGARASPCGGFSCHGAQALRGAGFSSYGPQALDPIETFQTGPKFYHYKVFIPGRTEHNLLELISM